MVVPLVVADVPPVAPPAPPAPELLPLVELPLVVKLPLVALLLVDELLPLVEVPVAAPLPLDELEEELLVAVAPSSLPEAPDPSEPEPAVTPPQA